MPARICPRLDRFSRTSSLCAMTGLGADPSPLSFFSPLCRIRAFGTDFKLDPFHCYLLQKVTFFPQSSQIIKTTRFDQEAKE